jgi:protocatechuate 3,4-dioxygenase beta subunit
MTQFYGVRSANNTYPGSVLTLVAGQVVKDLSLKLAPQGVIFGRVTDADGDPLPGAEVQVLRIYHSRGKRGVSPVGGASTDDQGSFRIANLPTGSYYLAADDTQSRIFGNTEGVRAGRAPSRLTSVLTYYPDAVDAANAIPLEIAPGSELRGIEIRIRREAVFSFRGMVIDSATGKPAAVPLDARLKDGPQIGLGMAGTFARIDGTFEIRNLLPGVYVVTAGTNTTADPRSAREEVNITDSDAVGVKLTLTPGAAMAGTVKLEGDGPPVHPTISLNGVDGTERGSNAQTKDDGTFELQGIASGKYAVGVYDLPVGVYVKSIRLGGQDVTRTKLDLTSGVSGTLDILLSRGAAEVLGTVKNKEGEAVSGVLITLWPKGLRPETVWSGAAQSATDQNGDFRIAGLAPGDYYLAAWEDIEADLTYDLDFLQRFTSQATAVTLEEGAHQTAQPKLISREDAAAEAAKLP